MVPGLPRGPGVHFAARGPAAAHQGRFVRQSKLANDPLRMPAADYMSRSALHVGKVVDIVCGGHMEGTYAVLGRLVRTGRLEIPKPRASRACLERISSSKPTKPDPMSIETDRPMALVQTVQQGLHQERLTGIVGTSFGSSNWLSVLSRVN